MTLDFKPPAVDQLATVDVAPCEYGAKITEIVGLVSFGGQSSWHGTDDYDVHCFSFAAWRQSGEPVTQKELLILRPVAVDSDWLSGYREGTVHKVRVLLAVDEPRAVFAEAVQNDIDDSELLAIATELRKRLIVETKTFGVLRFDRHSFEGAANWNGLSVRIHFEPDNGLDITSQLATAETLFADSTNWAKKINDFAVKEKLALANDWRDESDPQITAAEFLRRMTLDSIWIKPDGQFEFWYDDGDMFYGHSIQIRGSIAKGLTDSDIPG